MSRIIDKYLVVVHVDIVKNSGGEGMYKKYGTQRGVPAWTVLDTREKVLGDSGDGRDNVGYPYAPHEIDHYVKILKVTCPKISDAEINVIKTKLKEVVSKKKAKADRPTDTTDRAGK